MFDRHSCIWGSCIAENFIPLLAYHTMETNEEQAIEASKIMERVLFVYELVLFV
jgi:hypothetical protein